MATVEDEWLAVVKANQDAGRRHDPDFVEHGTLRRNVVEISALLPDQAMAVESLFVRYVLLAGNELATSIEDAQFSADAQALVALLLEV